MTVHPPENRALTAGVCRRLGIWPLDTRHRDRPGCMCSRCFGDLSTTFTVPTSQPPDELAHLRVKRHRVALPWEEDAA